MANFLTLTFPTSTKYSVVWMCHNVSNQLLIDGPFPIINNAAMNKLGHALFCASANILRIND